MLTYKLVVAVSPMIWVPNQLVGAPAGTDVTIDCHTEAYPRAISYWVYDNVMLLPTKKYGTDTTENSYRAHMKLTVRNLQQGDFGNYRCISKNSLGETEGSIRLYGKSRILLYRIRVAWKPNIVGSVLVQQLFRSGTSLLGMEKAANITFYLFIYFQDWDFFFLSEKR